MADLDNPPIKNVWELPKWELWEKFTPEIQEKLKNYLKQKYNLDEGAQINITKDELAELKTKLSASQEQKIEWSNWPKDWDKVNSENVVVETIWKFIYDDYIETKLSNGWDVLNTVVNTHNITTGIENSRLDSARKILDWTIDAELDKFDFLWDRKELIKAAMISKLISNPAIQQAQKWLMTLTKNISGLWKTTPSSITEALASWQILDSTTKKDIEWLNKMFISDISQYILGFKKIEKVFMDKWITDNKEQLNVISHIPYFNAPDKIYSWFSEELLPELFWQNVNFDVIKKTKKTPNYTPEELEKFKNFMLSSRANVESNLKFLEEWDNLKAVAFSILETPWQMWKIWKWLLEFLFNIPIIWKILAGYMWLDIDNPMADIESQLWASKTLKTLKKLGKTVDKSLITISDWVGPFKGLDLSEINVTESKKELKEMMKYKPEKISDEEYIKVAFGETWIDVQVPSDDWKKTETKTLKFTLWEDTSKDWKIDNEEFKSIIKTWMDFPVDKAKKTSEQESSKSTKAKTIKDVDIPNLNLEIKELIENRKDIWIILDNGFDITQIKDKQISTVILTPEVILNEIKWTDSKELYIKLFKYIDEYFKPKKEWWVEQKVNDLSPDIGTLLKDPSQFKIWLRDKWISISSKITDKEKEIIAKRNEAESIIPATPPK